MWQRAQGEGRESFSEESRPHVDDGTPEKNSRPFPRTTLAKMRLQRLQECDKALAGDVASFYLPYVETLLQQNDQIRFVCLKRPCEEVVRSFCQWVDRIHSAPTDHWSREPKDEFHYDQVWSAIFPKFDAVSREDAIHQYWNHYYTVAESLAET